MLATLVSTYSHPVALGLRYVSAFLKARGRGVKVRMLFVGPKGDEDHADLSAGLLGDFVDHCRDADVIGLSLMTNSFYRSRALTEALRRAGVRAPIIWGGAHPTVAPRESAEVADYVCVGEGEKAMLEVVELLQAGKDLRQARNLAYLKDGELVRNPPVPLTDDLDEYPFPDYEPDDHWVARGDRLAPATPELLRGALRRYRACSTRGCPYSCSFCNNTVQRESYRAWGPCKWVRRRSNENIIAELEGIYRRHPRMEAINLIDDLFLIRGEEEIARFVGAYRERVNLPLEVDAFPNTITDRKIELLARLPIALISMGIQSGCQETLRNLYNRPTPVDTVARAIQILSKHGLRTEYHYLVANPFESDQSRVETLRFVADHHCGPVAKPGRRVPAPKIRLFPLMFYPGARLYERARQEGVIGPHHEEAYRLSYHGKKFIRRFAYLEVWLAIALGLRGRGTSSRRVHRLIDFALHPWVRRRLDKPWFPAAAFAVYRLGRVVYRNLLAKPAQLCARLWPARASALQSRAATTRFRRPDGADKSAA